MARWAADSAEHVLSYFEKENPEDDRPRKAIEAARDWANDKIKCGEARKAAWAAHAAAREATEPSAIFVARAAGHAAATAHVPTHAGAVPYYILKATKPDEIEKENKWLHKLADKNLPKRLHPIAFPQLKNKKENQNERIH